MLEIFGCGDELTNYTTKSVPASADTPLEGLIYPYTILQVLPSSPKLLVNYGSLPSWIYMYKENPTNPMHAGGGHFLWL